MKALRHIDWSEICKAIADKQAIDIEDAIIENIKELEGGLVAKKFSFTGCVFRDPLVFAQVEFAESISFTRCRFEGGVGLHLCKVHGVFLAENTVFRSEFKLIGTSILGVTSIDHCIFRRAFDINSGTFGSLTNIGDTRFRGESYMGLSTMEGQLQVKACTFRKPFHLVRDRVAGNVYLQDLAVLGDLSLAGTRISSNLEITETVFGPTAGLVLDMCTVNDVLYITDCVFANATGKCMSLANMTALNGCEIAHVVCAGDFSMFNSRIGRYLFIGAMSDTASTSPRLVRERSKVEELFEMPDAERHLQALFGKNVDVSRVRVEGGVSCSNVGFLSLKGAGDRDLANFSEMRVEGTTYLMHCVFAEGADFNRVDLYGVFGTNSVYSKHAQFEGARFHRAVRFLPGCKFMQGAEFYFSEFDQEANFGGAEIHRRLSLRYVQFRHSLLFELKNDGTGVPDTVSFVDGEGRKVAVELLGCAYAQLILPDDFADLRGFIDRIPDHDANALIRLEQYLRRIGRPELGDAARYIRHSLAGAKLRPLSLRWCADRLRKYATHYGTAVMPVVVLMGLLGVFGLLVTRISTPALKGWVETIQLACWSSVPLIAALVADVVRRNLWPE